jgi:DNA-binding transcriptional regulator YdaS (Cro superfamily)
MGVEITTADVPVLLQSSVGSLERWLDIEGVAVDVGASSLVESPTISAASALVSGAEAVIHAYLAVAQRVAPGMTPTIGAVLHLELVGACASRWIGVTQNVETDVALALASRLRDIIGAQNADGTSGYPVVELKVPRHSKPLTFSPAALAYVAAATLNQWATEHRETDYQLKLERIKTGLGLRNSELAKLLDVSREAIRQWSGGSTIAPERWETIDRLNSFVTKVQQYFRLETVPALVRRRLTAFNGLSALQLIGIGREQELLARYKRVFDSEATQ